MIGSLPRHLYVLIDTTFTHTTPIGFIPAVWFGLVSYPSRVWGCTVLLESGAVYRNLPPHALAFNDDPAGWTEYDAQTWNCYGSNFQAYEYDYLSELRCRVRTRAKEYDGEYLFTVLPMDDGFSAAPGQAKEFTFVKLDNGRLTIAPTNHVLFEELSFTNKLGKFPERLKRQTDIYRCE